MHVCVVIIEEGLESGIFMKDDISHQYNLSDKLRNWFYENNMFILENVLWTRNANNKKIIFYFNNEEDATAFKKLKWL